MRATHGLHLDSVETCRHPGGKDGWLTGFCRVPDCEYRAHAPRLDGLIALFEEHTRGKRESQRTYHPTEEDVAAEVLRMREAASRTPLRRLALEAIENEARERGSA